MTDDMTNGPSAPFISLGEPARLVGVSVRTIHRLRKRGALPPEIFVNGLGRRLVRVDWARFEEWLREFDGEIRDPAPRRAPEAPPQAEGPKLTVLP
jgi:predicted DNA-binding transcriptional regulator AlpA